MKYLLFILISINTLQAQDLIYLKNKTLPINAKVIEINSVEVKYKFPSDSFPIMSYSKAEIQRIELSNGYTIEIERDEDLNENERVGSIKSSLFSMVFDHINISYEGYIRGNQSWEITAGIIGVGHQADKKEEPKGEYFKLGYKWMSQKKLISNIQQKKYLSGFYVKPELSIGNYTIKYDDISVGKFNYTGPNYWNGYYSYSYEPVPSAKIMFCSLLMNFGYQAISIGGLTLDVNVGFGSYLYSKKEVRDFNYTFIAIGSDDIPLAVNMGIKLGYTFCKEKRFQVIR